MPDEVKDPSKNSSVDSSNSSANASTDEEKKKAEEEAEAARKAEEEYQRTHTDPYDPKDPGKGTIDVGKGKGKAAPIDNITGIQSASDMPGVVHKDRLLDNDKGKVVGSNYPLIRINDKYFNENELKYVEIDCTGFLPKIYVILNTIDGELSGANQPKEGDIISVFLAPTQAAYRSIRVDFIIRSNDTLFGSVWSEGTNAQKYSFVGEMYIPNWKNSTINVSGFKSSRDILIDTAKALQLGFFFNDPENTRDEQAWQMFQMPMKSDLDEESAKFLNNQEPSHSNVQSFIQHVALHAYKKFTAFYDCWIDLRYAISFININMQLGEDGLDEKIDIVPFQKAFTKNRAKEAKSEKSTKELKKDAKEGKTEPQLKILSNLNSDNSALTPFFVLKYGVSGNSRKITELMGIDKVTSYTEGTHTASEGNEQINFKFSIPYNETKLQNGFYLLIGPGQNLSYRQGDVLLKYVPNLNVSEGGQIKDTLANSDVKKGVADNGNMHASGNTHKFYKMAVEHNRINNLQLKKKIVDMTLNGLNFAVMRGEKIPALIVNHDTMNQAMAVHTDHLIQRGLLDEFSGWFIIDGIKYIYSPNNSMSKGTSWKTELKLVRREWPIPGESAFPYTSDEARKSEQADGVEIIVSTHGESGTVKQAIDDKTIAIGDITKIKNVPTTGLATFMVTLWNLLKLHIEPTGKNLKLVQGRWWAVNDEDPPKREDGLPWVMWDDEFKCMDEAGNVVYIKTSISNHFFGEAINVAYGAKDEKASEKATEANKKKAEELSKKIEEQKKKLEETKKEKDKKKILEEIDKLTKLQKELTAAADVYKDAVDELLTKVYNNNVILQFMYKNGISAYKETFARNGTVILTLHFGTNTSEQANFWNGLFNKHPETYDMYNAYFEWNIHNSADPRKTIKNENQPPPPEPEPEPDPAETTSTTSSGSSSASTSSGTSAGKAFGNISALPSGVLVGKSDSAKHKLCGISGSARQGKGNHKQYESLIGYANLQGPIGSPSSGKMSINKALVSDIEAIVREIHKKMPSFVIKQIWSWAERTGNSSYHPCACAVDINWSHGCPWFDNCTSKGGKGGGKYRNNGRNMAATQADIKKVNGRWCWTQSYNNRVIYADTKFKGEYNANYCIWSWDHPVVLIFLAHGWGWGGSYGDSMHFSITGG